jgi:zinc transporter 11
MIEGQHPVVQALLGTLVTWGFTALGSAMVFVLDVEDKRTSQKILDGMLGFAGGVMLAASYWSLLAPAIEIAAESELYGPEGRWAFVPAAVGFTMGALTLFGTERVLPMLEKVLGITPQSLQDAKKKKDDDYKEGEEHEAYDKPSAASTSSFRRVLLLVIAITLHNLPEGMAVGVGFGSVGQSSTASFANAVNLAIGIGLQNFPEGLAVSMPLRREGTSAFRAFMWGQASGLVEPVGGVSAFGGCQGVDGCRRLMY